MYVFPINTFFPQRNRTAFHRMDCKCEVIGMNLTSGFLFLKERKRKSQNEWEWVCSTCPELYRIFQNQAACCPSTCWIVSRGGGVFPARWSNPSVSSCICISVCNCDCICVRMQCVFLSEFVLHLLDSKRRRRRTVWEEEGECCQPGDLMPVSVVVYVFVSVCMCICVWICFCIWWIVRGEFRRRRRVSVAGQVT